MRGGMRGITRKYLLIATLSLVGLVGSSCSAPLLPSPVMPRVSRAQNPDEEVMSILQTEWKKLLKEDLSREERLAAVESYNKWLLTLLRRMRYDLWHAEDLRRNGMIYRRFRAMREDLPPHRQIADVYDDIVPAPDVRTRGLEERYIQSGIGVPVVGIIPPKKAEQKDGLAPIRTRGTVSTMTALLEFPDNPAEQPRLKLIPRHLHEEVQIGKRLYPLAADFSASLEVYWNLTQIKSGRYLGLLRPQRLRDLSGLSCIERYNPHKIPVVFIHGLASSADTFIDLVNRLLNDKDIRKRYQFWYYNYPTGVSWVYSAARFRQALQDIRNRLEHGKKNSNWDRMVVIAHSMGGLITHYNQCVEPWKMLKCAPFMRRESLALLSEKYIDKPLPAPELEKIRSLYYFRPTKASQIIYMATPHRGAPMAQRFHSILLARLVQLPHNLVQDIFGLATLQENNLLNSPGRLADWLTSIGQLSPQSYSIRGLSPLAVQATPTYSIIGDKGRNDTPHSSDGVVPYWSSHISWGGESIVPSDHSVQEDPKTAEIVKEILLNGLSNKQ